MAQQNNQLEDMEHDLITTQDELHQIQHGQNPMEWAEEPQIPEDPLEQPIQGNLGMKSDAGSQGMVGIEEAGSSVNKPDSPKLGQESLAMDG